MIVNIKKRYAYAIIGLLVLAVGFFVVNALTPGVAPNPGHLITQVAPPAGCSAGQVLGWSGSSWGCVILPVDTDTDDQTLSISGQSLSISSGNSVSLPESSNLQYIVNRHGNTGPCSTWCSTLGLTCITGHNAGTWGSATVSCASWAPVCVCSK